MENPKALFDSFGRKHDYLRISLTDKCNFRCTYCMPSENMKFMPSEKLMSANEIIQFATIFNELGVRRIRFTGGEPTLRKDLTQILKGISPLDVKLSITTNALLLDEFIDDFKQAGLLDVNVSIDSIDRKKFFEITKRDTLDKVISNIRLARDNALNLKLNVVVIRGTNDDEIVSLLEWSARENLAIRFIEYMPFFGNEWNYKNVVSQKEILNIVSDKYDFIDSKSSVDSTSENYFIPKLNSSFGIIPTVSNPFCQGCSRIRLTADGKIKNCLFSSDEEDLLMSLRNNEDVKNIIRDNIFKKKAVAADRIDFKHEKAKSDYANNRSMVAIGG